MLSFGRTSAAVMACALLACAFAAFAGCSREDVQSSNKAQTMSNLSGRGGLLDYSPFTHRHDAESMREAVLRVPGVTGAHFQFDGANAYVTLVVRNDLQPQEIPTVESQAATTLRFNFPRYVFHMQPSIREENSRAEAQRTGPRERQPAQTPNR